MNQKLLSAFDWKKRLTDWALLLFIALACYWPFTFSVFSAKNDNIIAFLPLRYNISEAIRSGHFPFWSPYIYMGFPMHSDMQSGCWNPFVWIFSLFSRYDLTMLHMEIMLYIFLAGTGMYKLLQSLKLNRQVSLTGAAAFMLSGFVTDVGGSNMLFLAAAAFIPFVFCYYLAFLKVPGFKAAIKTALALTLLFLTSYPSFFILTCYILFAGLVTTIIINYKKTGTFLARAFVLHHFVLALFFLAICAPAIISYWELLPYYKRGAAVSLQLSQQNNFHPRSLASLLFPTASIKDTVNGTDLICRNIYFNSFLLVFFAGLAWLRKNTFHYFVLAGTLYFLLYSLGEYSLVHEWSYELLPLLNTFRHPANARLFVIIGAIVLSCCNLHSVKDETGIRKIKWTAILLLAFCICFFVYSIFNSSLPGKISALSGSGNKRDLFKSFLDSLNFADALLINSFLQILFLGILVFFILKRNRFKMALFIFVLNSFLFAQLSLPFTFSGKTAPRDINRLLHSFPKGYPVPDPDVPIKQFSDQSKDEYDKVGLVSFYSKKIGAATRQVTPTFMLSYDSMLTNETVKNIVYNNPFAFLADTGINSNAGVASSAILVKANRPATTSFKITGFNNNYFAFEVESAEKTNVCLQQVFLPGWKACIDGKEAAIHRGNIAFMYVTVPPGKHAIEFLYGPRHIIYALILSIIAIITSLVLLKRKN